MTFAESKAMTAAMFGKLVEIRIQSLCAAASLCVVLLSRFKTKVRQWRALKVKQC